MSNVLAAGVAAATAARTNSPINANHHYETYYDQAHDDHHTNYKINYNDKANHDRNDQLHNYATDHNIDHNNQIDCNSADDHETWRCFARVRVAGGLLDPVVGVRRLVLLLLAVGEGARRVREGEHARVSAFLEAMKSSDAVV